MDLHRHRQVGSSGNKKSSSSHPDSISADDKPVASSMNEIYNDLTKSTLEQSITEGKLDDEEEKTPSRQTISDHKQKPETTQSLPNIPLPLHRTEPSRQSSGSQPRAAHPPKPESAQRRPATGGNIPESDQQVIDDALFRSPSPQMKSLEEIKEKLNFTPRLQNTDITSTEDETDFTLTDPLFDINSDNTLLSKGGHRPGSEDSSTLGAAPILETVSSGEVAVPLSSSSFSQHDGGINNLDLSSGVYNGVDRPGYEPRVITTMTSATPTLTSQESFQKTYGAVDGPILHPSYANQAEDGSAKPRHQYDTKCPSKHSLDQALEEDTQDDRGHGQRVSPCPRLASPFDAKDGIVDDDLEKSGATTTSSSRELPADSLTIPIISANPISRIHVYSDDNQSLNIRILDDDHALGQSQSQILTSTQPQSPGVMEELVSSSNSPFPLMMAILFIVIIVVVGFLLFAFRS